MPVQIMSKEIACLILSFVTKIEIAIIIGNHFMSRFGFDYLDYDHFTRLPLWTIGLLAPLALFFSNKHYWIRQNRVNKCEPAPIYPHRDPLLGIDWITSTLRTIRNHTLLQTWDNLFRTVGDTFWVQNIGAWIVMTNEPENIKAILSSDFESWKIGGLRQKVPIMAIGPKGIFSVNDQEWHDARAMIRPSFVRNQIADLECTNRHVENFLRQIPKNGERVDLQQLLYMFTIDISTDFMFGSSTNTLVTPTPEGLEFTKSFEYALLSASTRGRLGWIAFFFPDSKLTAARETCDSFIDRLILKAKTEDKVDERAYVFMNEMLKSGASREHVRGQLLAMILGGRDTSASVMSNLFWTLARRRDVWEELKVEVRGLEGRKPSWEDLKDMKYLNRVLKETLRLWAPVSSNMRAAARDTTLPRGGGPNGESPLFIPKGTGCRFSSHSLHRRKDVYGEDAEEFRPERWESLRVMWEYIPFSGGPRICLGQQFALTQMLYLVTRVLQTFESIEAADDKPLLHVAGTTLKLVNGCWVSLKAS